HSCHGPDLALNALRKALVRATVLHHFQPGFMAERKVGCLTIFLFVALCASVFVNCLLTMMAFRGFAAGVHVEEPLPRFREIVIERGTRGVSDRIALITLRGLISSSIPGTVSDSMVEDMRLALQQARDDSRVKAIVLEIDSPGGEVTAA